MRESDLLEYVCRPDAALAGRVTIPPGDDTAQVVLNDRTALVTVDQLADGIHFNLASTPIEKVGRKAVARSLSDVAAMAAMPWAAVVAVSLPRTFGTQRARLLFDSVRATAGAYDCPLVGGDISIWDHPLLLTVTVLARPAGIEPITRGGAQVGDRIFVTGQLGGSQHTLDGHTHHLDFEPRITVARKLAADTRLRPHSMIDLSDGLAADVARLCRAVPEAGLGAQLWADRLPISRAAKAASQIDHAPPWLHALVDGEDYELCFTLLGSDDGPVAPQQIDGVRITQVGVITAAAGPTVRLRMADGSTRTVDDLGWQHRGTPG